MDQKARGLLAYLFGIIGGLVIMFAFKDNTKETNYHAGQSVVLCAGFIAIKIIIIILCAILTFFSVAIGISLGFLIAILGILNTVTGIAYIALAIVGMIKAYKEEEFKIPGISNITESIFKSKLG